MRLVENFGLPLGEERAVTLEPTPLQPKGSVMSFGAQTLEEVDRSWLVMREVELSEEVEAISALAQELVSERSVVER